MYSETWTVACGISTVGVNRGLVLYGSQARGETDESSDVDLLLLLEGPDYGCFYAAEALLLSKELSYSRHSQVVAQFGRHFAKTEELDTRYHRLLIEAFKLRQAAGYSAAPETVGGEDAEHTIREAKEFLAAAREYLERQ